MAKATNKSTIYTSSHRITISTTVNKLIEAYGQPTYKHNTGEDKVNFEWELELTGEHYTGEIFTIYDWKEYRKIGLDETIEFHIGGFMGIHTKVAKDEIVNDIRNLKYTRAGLTKEEGDVLDLLDM